MSYITCPECGAHATLAAQTEDQRTFRCRGGQRHEFTTDLAGNVTSETELPEGIVHPAQAGDQDEDPEVPQPVVEGSDDTVVVGEETEVELD